MNLKITEYVENFSHVDRFESKLIANSSSSILGYH